MRPITIFEKQELSNQLERFHRVFQAFWRLSSISFVDGPIQTAAVYLPQEGQCSVVINEAFWEALNEDERLFVVIHECLHVILNHGFRNGKGVPGSTPRLVNIAQDITINEMIVDMFGFDRNLIRDWKKYCWIDTCFEKPGTVLRNQPFEYYLGLLGQQGEQKLDELFGDGDGGIMVDDHDFGDNEPGANGDPKPGGFIDKLADELSEDELKKVSRGTQSSPFLELLEKRKRKKLSIKKHIAHLKATCRDVQEQERPMFIKADRRFQMIGGSLLLPGPTPVSRINPRRLLTAMFMDVSGSCLEHVQFFNSVAQSFMKEDIFDLRCFAFDTSVKPVRIGEPLEMGGGTAFDIIETKVQELKAEFKRYPDCVIVVTDGYGNSVAPQIPRRWLWLLTSNGTKNYISALSKAVKIKDVVLD